MAVSGQIVINEFSAANATIVADPDYHDYSDWIELYNAGSEDQNLKDFYITDNLGDPVKWQIEFDTIIPAGAFMLIWTDGLNTGLHANFKLSALGEEIGLFSPAHEILDTLTFSQQKTDISLGRVPDGGEKWGYFLQPTPGASNSTIAYLDYCSLIPEFSKRGGFYSSPFQVELSSPQGGVIRFTIDGSEPEESSPIYTSAIMVGPPLF